MSEDVPPQLTEFQAGSVVAGYRLEAQVGAGGMAVVFRARDERLGRPVALKILSPALASGSEFRRRFIAESRAAAAVDDPHIIPVYEAGEADGVLFIAMRFVAGGDLRDVLKREGALPPERAADLVSPVASALDAAHEAGLVHRDVKPGNILVDTGPGRPDHVYLSDFGIVRRVAAERLTRMGVNVGTPDYMAPEQIQGRDVDGRADQYSLACVTFQLLTGTVPFQRDQVLAIIYAHMSDPPPSLVSRRPDLPAAVDPVVAKAMAKTTEKRYASCRDFADALREALGLMSYHRRSSATLPPPYPSPPATPPGGPADVTADSAPGIGPPGAAETPESAVPDHPDAVTGEDPRSWPWTAAAAPAESLQPPDMTVTTDSEWVAPPSEIPPPPPDTAGMPAAAGVVPGSGRLGGQADASGGTAPPKAAAVAGNGSTVEVGRLTVPVSGGGAPPAQRPPRRRGPVTAWIGRHRLPVFALACAIAAAAATLPFISPGQPSSSRPAASSGPSTSSRPAATGTGWVSLGNLSENPASVDVYLYPSGGSSPQFVQHDVAYGTILPYQPVTVGDYSVKMRAAGSSASSIPVWSVGLTVRAGGTYTVVPLRATAQQGQLRVIDNNLTTPTGKSFVRVIQADLDQGQVTFHCSCAPGAPGNIVTDAAPGTVSAQAPIPAGTWTMSATGPSATASRPVPLTAGTVHTEVVISKPGGGIEIVNLTDGVPSYRRVPVDLPPNWRNLLITSLAFSPSGATLAVASLRICLWDIAASACINSFGSASADSVAFSPDGKTLAAGDRSGSTYLWNVLTGTQSAALTDPDLNGVLSVAFSRDGKILAAGDSNGRTYLWNVAARMLIATLPDPGSKAVSSVAFSPDGKILAAGGSNGTYLWDVATRKQIGTLGDPGSKGVLSVAFSPDGKILVAGDDNGQTYLWNVATAKLIAVLRAPGSTGVISVACSPDNTTMAAADNNGKVYVWNVITGKLITPLADPNNVEIDSVAFSADGKALAIGDQIGGVFLWYISLSA